MRCIVYQDTRGAVLADVPKPTLAAGEALIAVEACGLCGSDILKLTDPETTGRVLGHEIAGRVAELGPGVEGFRVGDRVLLAHHVPCGSCHYCRRGSPSMCRQFKSTNVDPGGFSEFVRASAEHVRHTLLKLPDTLDFAAATLTEPLACCLRNAKRLRVAPGDTVGIVGLGSIGLMTGQLLRHMKATVMGFDLDAGRVERAGQLGMIASNGARAADDIARLTQNRGLDCLIFTAGSPELASERLRWVRDGGTLSIFAEFHRPEEAREPGRKAPRAEAVIDLNELYHRELTITSSYSPSPADLREALELIASGAVTVDHLTDRTFPLEGFTEAVRRTKSREILKAILLPAAQAVPA